MNNNYRVKGAFFENMKPTGPAFTGFVELDPAYFQSLISAGGPVKIEIALWPKTSQKGTNYFQVSEDKGKKKPAQSSFAPAPQSSFTRRQYSQPTTGRQQPQSPQGRSPFNDLDDEVPFAPEWRG